MSNELLDPYACMMTKEEIESPFAERIAALLAQADEWKRRIQMTQDDDASFYQPQIDAAHRLAAELAMWLRELDEDYHNLHHRSMGKRGARTDYATCNADTCVRTRAALAAYDKANESPITGAPAGLDQALNSGDGSYHP